MATEAEIGAMQPHAKECPGLPGEGETRSRGGNTALPTPGFSLWLPKLHKVSLCCFKPPGS